MNDKGILIVSADAANARVLTRMLRRRRFAVTSTRDPAGALEAAGATRPGYVVLEQDLPERSGLSLIRPMLATVPDSKILVLASCATIESAVDAIKLGAIDYLAKPAGLDEILRGLGLDGVADAAESGPGGETAATGLDQIQWTQIVGALARHEGNVSATAAALRMNRRTLQRKLEAHQSRTGKDVAAGIRASSDRRRRIELRRQWEASRRGVVSPTGT